MSFLIQQTLIYAVPLMIVALAGVFAERSGIINLALEGIMIFGAFIGVLFVRQMQGVDTFIAAKAAGDWGTLQGLVLLAMLVSAASFIFVVLAILLPELMHLNDAEEAKLPVGVLAAVLAGVAVSYLILQPLHEETHRLTEASAVHEHVHTECPADQTAQPKPH